MSLVQDSSTHEENLSQPLHTHSKQYKIAGTSLINYGGNFNVTNINNNLIFSI